VFVRAEPELVKVAMFLFDVHQYCEFVKNASVEPHLRKQLTHRWFVGGAAHNRLVVMIEDWKESQKSTPGGTENVARNTNAYEEIPRWSESQETMTAKREILEEQLAETETEPYDCITLLRLCAEMIQPLNVRVPQFMEDDIYTGALELGGARGEGDGQGKFPTKDQPRIVRCEQLPLDGQDYIYVVESLYKGKATRGGDDAPAAWTDEFNRCNPDPMREAQGTQGGCTLPIAHPYKIHQGDRHPQQAFQRGNVLAGLPPYGGACFFGVKPRAGVESGSSHFGFEPMSEPFGLKDFVDHNNFCYYKDWPDQERSRRCKAYGPRGPSVCKAPFSETLKEQGWSKEPTYRGLVGTTYDNDCKRRFWQRGIYHEGLALRLPSKHGLLYKNGKGRYLDLVGQDRCAYYFADGPTGDMKGVFSLSYGTVVSDPFGTGLTIEVNAMPTQTNEGADRWYKFTARSEEDAKAWRLALYYNTDEGILKCNNLRLADLEAVGDGKLVGAEVAVVLSQLQLAQKAQKEGDAKKAGEDGDSGESEPSESDPDEPDDPEAGANDAAYEHGEGVCVSVEAPVSFDQVHMLALAGRHEGVLTVPLKPEHRGGFMTNLLSILSCGASSCDGEGSSACCVAETADKRSHSDKDVMFKLKRLRAWMESMQGLWRRSFVDDGKRKGHVYYYNIKTGMSAWKLPEQEESRQVPNVVTWPQFRQCLKTLGIPNGLMPIFFTMGVDLQWNVKTTNPSWNTNANIASDLKYALKRLCERNADPEQKPPQDPDEIILADATVDIRLVVPFLALLIGCTVEKDPKATTDQHIAHLATIIFEASDWDGDGLMATLDLWYMWQSIHHGLRWFLCPLLSPPDMAAIAHRVHAAMCQMVLNHVKKGEEWKFNIEQLTKRDFKHSTNLVIDAPEYVRTDNHNPHHSQRHSHRGGQGHGDRTPHSSRRRTELAFGLLGLKDQLHRTVIQSVQLDDAKLHLFKCPGTQAFLELKIVFEAYAFKAFVGGSYKVDEEDKKWATKADEGSDSSDDETESDNFLPFHFIKELGKVTPLLQEEFVDNDGEKKTAYGIFSSGEGSLGGKFPEESQNYIDMLGTVKTDDCWDGQVHVLRNGVLSMGTRFAIGEMLTSDTDRSCLADTHNGRFRYVTEGGAYILRSISGSELKELRAKADEYFTYLEDHPATMLEVILGAYRWDSPTYGSINFVLQKNSQRALNLDGDFHPGARKSFDQNSNSHMVEYCGLPNSDPDNHYGDEPASDGTWKSTVLRQCDHDELQHVLESDLDFLKKVKWTDYELCATKVQLDFSDSGPIGLMNRKAAELTKAGSPQFLDGTTDVTDRINEFLKGLQMKMESFIRFAIVEPRALEAPTPDDIASFESQLHMCLVVLHNLPGKQFEGPDPANKGHVRDLVSAVADLWKQVQGFMADNEDKMYVTHDRQERWVFGISGLFSTGTSSFWGHGSKSPAEHAAGIQDYTLKRFTRGPEPAPRP